MRDLITLPDGSQVTISVEGPENKIMWASDWTKVPELDRLGLLTHKTFPSLWGHTEYYYNA